MRRTVTATLLASSTCLALFVLGACERTSPTPGTAATPETNATAEVQEIKDSPSEFYGRTLTLAGEIEQVHGPHAFVLEGDGSLFDDEILVVTRSPVDFGARGLDEDDDVLVKGKVEHLVIAEIERETGWDVPAEIEIELRDKPVVIAESIRAIEETARWSESEQPKAAIVSITAIGLIQPNDLVGQAMKLESIPVQAKTGKGLWVGFQHRNMLLVVPPEGTDLSGIQVGDVVSVDGEIATMPAADEAMQRFGIDDTLRAQVEQEPLYIDAKTVSELDPDAQAKRATGPVGIDQFARAPGRYVGSEVQGEAVVTKVISDRGFWLRTEDGSTIFAVVREDVPRHEMIDIDEGQRIRLTGSALSASQVDQIAGTLEQDTTQAIRSQEAFLSTHWRNVEIIEKGAAAG